MKRCNSPSNFYVLNRNDGFWCHHRVGRRRGGYLSSWHKKNFVNGGAGGYYRG